MRPCSTPFPAAQRVNVPRKQQRRCVRACREEAQHVTSQLAIEQLYIAIEELLTRYAALARCCSSATNFNTCT